MFTRVEETLRTLLGRASDMLENSYSGYIAGSTLDEQFEKEREALVKECREALSEPQS